MLLLEVGDHPVHLVENGPLLLLHDLDARGHELGLQAVELSEQLLTIGAGRFGILTMAFTGVISPAGPKCL